jgi:putative CocE/NonD family hydrolase
MVGAGADERDRAGNVRVIDNAWITLEDCRLAARIWLPEDVEAEPVPAILEYLPYRKGDHMAARDARVAGYFAARGYAYVRVDIRGTGDSDGILQDEYLPQEQQDAIRVIDWLAAKPWCSGAVGMIGISWGGFNGLQVAARRPPHLRAVISLCSTDDRYADDVHYLGGCLLADEMLPWASTMLAINALPPDPQVAGEGWRATWFDRLENTPPFIDTWMRHQRRDAYWKQGSVCEDYEAIECPVYMVGGWADGYTNAIPRFLEHYRGMRKGLIGPWAHTFPQAGAPGPAIGFLQECLRWWDRWLKGIQNGIEDEPMLRAWLQDPAGPGHHPDRPGRWVVEETWPSPRLEHVRLSLADGILGGTPGDDRPLAHSSAQRHGLLAGAWCPYGVPSDFPPDQREEDALCLSFTSEPLDERLELLGRPRVRVGLSVDRAVALIAARLCDVAPDGTSALISRGALNLTHRDGHGSPEPLIPHQCYDVDLELDVLGQAVGEGHRLRLSLSTTYWPWLWPSPDAVTLWLHPSEDTFLELPVRPPSPEDGRSHEFGPPETGREMETEILAASTPYRSIHHDVVGGDYDLELNHDGGQRLRLVEEGIEIDSHEFDRRSIREGDPLSAHVCCERRYEVARDGWGARIETSSTMSSDARDFHLTDVLEAFENGRRVFAKTWSRRIPRDCV